MNHLAKMAGIFRARVVSVNEGCAAGEEDDGGKSHQGETTTAEAANLPQRRHRNKVYTHPWKLDDGIRVKVAI